MLRLERRIRRFLGRDEKGSSTVEFVILFPVFITILLSSIESGILMLRYVMLERGVDMSVRSLRLGVDAPENEAELLTQVCNVAGLIPDCTNTVKIELTRVSTGTWTLPAASPTCVVRGETLDPLLEPEYTLGAPHDIMLVRACAVFRPFFPMSGLALRLPRDANGDYSLVSSSAFVNEPT